MSSADSKPWYASKTFWFGVAQMVGGAVLQALAGGTADAKGIGLAVLGAVTVFLRTQTAAPLGK